MKQKTIKSQKNKWRAIEYSCFIGEFISFFTPFIAIGIANYDKYFVEYNGTKMSIAAAMAFGVMGLAIFLISKKKLENSFISLLIGWAVFAFIFTMMGEIITDLAMIMWFGFIGLSGAYILDIGSKKARNKKLKIIEAMETANKEEMVAQYKEEKQETKKVKIKIKK